MGSDGNGGKSNIEKSDSKGGAFDVHLLSPYHGGSHQAWAEGLCENSGHNIDLLTLPDRFWKWRMHGGAITLAREYLALGERSECLMATDMLDLTTFLALTRSVTSTIPTILYMHENQLTYPLPDDPEQGPMRRQKGERDLHYGFINVASMLAADLVLFNSEYHRLELLGALPSFLKHFPDYNEMEIANSIQQRSQIIPVGVDLARLETKRTEVDTIEPPLILWNHRWEYDKGPARFFKILYRVQESGIPFRLALCGRSFRQQPAEFSEAIEKLSQNIIHVGYADEETYRRLLWESTISLSTASHEFFGVSTIEAIYCHSFPILPLGLNYPALIPLEFHRHCLYSNQDEFYSILLWALSNPGETKNISKKLSEHVSIYDWQRVSQLYDMAITDLCR
jgi:glycosyltransferase involved in cell wall biosynthesis